MSQTWNFPMASTATLSDSRTYINDSCASLKSSFSGTSAPGSPVAGQFYFNTSTYALMAYSGSSWYQLCTVSSTYGGLLPLSAGSSYPLSGPLYCGAQQIKNMADPSASTDAVSLNYLTTYYLPLAGGTMSGNIVLGSNYATCTATPSSDDHLCRKAYVDLHVEKAGDTMTGDLDFGSSYTATGLAAPSAADDAATKSYVDDEFDTTTGHDHDGTDSKKVEFDDLAATGATVSLLLQARSDDIVGTRDIDVAGVEAQAGVAPGNYANMASSSVTLSPNERRLIIYGFRKVDTEGLKWRLKRDSTVLVDVNANPWYTIGSNVFAYEDTYATGGSVSYTLEAYGAGSSNTYWDYAFVHTT